MNGSMIYEAMGGIRSVYVEEAEKQPFAKPLWQKFLPLAACLAVIVGLSACMLYLSGWHFSEMPAGLSQILPDFSAAKPQEIPPESAFYYQRTNLQKILRNLARFLGASSLAVPFVCLLRQVSPRKTHIWSCVLYLAYLISCICTVWLSVAREWWGNLYSDLPSMFKYGILLLVIGLIFNGLLYLKNRKLAILLALISCLLFLLQPPREQNLIEPDTVTPTQSTEQGPELVELINQYGGKRTIPLPSNHVSNSWTAAAISTEDGCRYVLDCIYDHAFSFNPFHFGEDEVHYELTKFNAQGRAVKAWELHYDFETAYLELEVTP